jgi:hypothetical protein
MLQLVCIEISAQFFLPGKKAFLKANKFASPVSLHVLTMGVACCVHTDRGLVKNPKAFSRKLT